MRTPQPNQREKRQLPKADSAFGSSGNGAIGDIWPSLWLAGTFNLLAVPGGPQVAQHAAAGPHSRLAQLSVPWAKRSKSQHYVRNVAANT